MIGNLLRGRGIGLPRMRSLVLVAGGRQLVAGVEESASFFVCPVVLSCVPIVAVHSPVFWPFLKEFSMAELQSQGGDSGGTLYSSSTTVQ